MKISEMPEQAINRFLTKQTRDVKNSLVQILFEFNAAKEMHPNWPVKPGLNYKNEVQDYVHAAAVVTEEAGELLKASLEFQYEKKKYYHMHQEAMQTGAMAVRFLKSLPEKD